MRQGTVAHSTAEAELVASSWAAREMIGLKNLVNEVFPSLKITLVMFGDNEAANLMAACQAGIRKVRHLDLANLYVRTVTEQGLIRVQYVESSKNVADMLTKVLPAQQIRFLMHLMGFSQ